MANSKKHKRKGLYGTLLFHTLLLLSFMFMGLNYTIPPPPEEGITINFGFDDFGGGAIQPEEVVEELKETVELVEEVSTADVIETPTQTTEDAPAIKTEEKPKKETPTEKNRRKGRAPARSKSESFIPWKNNKP